MSPVGPLDNNAVQAVAQAAGGGLDQPVRARVFQSQSGTDAPVLRRLGDCADTVCAIRGACEFASRSGGNRGFRDSVAKTGDVARTAATIANCADIVCAIWGRAYSSLPAIVVALRASHVGREPARSCMSSRPGNIAARDRGNQARPENASRATMTRPAVPQISFRSVLRDGNLCGNAVGFFELGPPDKTPPFWYLNFARLLP